MGTSVIIAENLTKSYYRVKTGSRKSSGFSALFSKNVESFKALDNLNFEVHQGEILGLIGGNGAGKTTLLKLMARITRPTSGRLGIKGRLSALLELGTGFHPDLTGRENILLNGSLLGMSRQEILHKMDQIIDFSGIEAFIDTQVKNYSSGMFVRLGFSVSAAQNCPGHTGAGKDGPKAHPFARRSDGSWRCGIPAQIIGKSGSTGCRWQNSDSGQPCHECIAQPMPSDPGFTKRLPNSQNRYCLCHQPIPRYHSHRKKLCLPRALVKVVYFTKNQCQ